jgi:hypothetical protein
VASETVLTSELARPTAAGDSSTPSLRRNGGSRTIGRSTRGGDLKAGVNGIAIRLLTCVRHRLASLLVRLGSRRDVFGVAWAVVLLGTWALLLIFVHGIALFVGYWAALAIWYPVGTWVVRRFFSS